MKHYQQKGTVPELFALGFAAYLYFLKPVKQVGEQFYGEQNREPYPIQDECAALFYKRWATLSVEDLVQEVLSDTGFWGEDLCLLPGFQQTVTDKLNQIMHQGMRAVIEGIQSKKEVAA